jgi:hypothetical protein
MPEKTGVTKKAANLLKAGGSEGLGGLISVFLF